MWAESKKPKNKPNESQQHANAKYVSKLKHFNLTGLASGGDIIVSIGRQIRCVVVTPEKAVLDQQVDMVCLPMVDGELGVLPGRLAMIGNILPGVLRLNSGNQMKRLFIDGGFVQVRSDTVTVLTPRALESSEIDGETARKVISASPPKEVTAKSLDDHLKSLRRARAMLKIAKPS